MIHAESNFQQMAVRMLRANGFYCFSVPNGTQLKPTQSRIAKAEGMLAGVSDVIILLPGGRTVFVEFKNPNGKGRQSPAQRDFEENVLAFGFEYLLWSEWKQVEDFINGRKKELAHHYKVGGTD